MFGFGKKRKVDPQMDTTAQNIVPINLNEAHSFAAPATDEYPAQFAFGTPSYADRLNIELPTIKNQDEILVHYFQPPAAKNPQQWYNDRNKDKIYRGTQEHFFTDNVSEVVSPDQMEDNPWWHGVPVPTRPTAHMSPSNYRFIRPYDQRWERTNVLAQSGSQARVAYPYPVGGMQPQNTLRNTFRLEPPARDIENMDLNNSKVAAVVPAVYVSPQQTSSRWGL